MCALQVVAGLGPRRPRRAYGLEDVRAYGLRSRAKALTSGAVSSVRTAARTDSARSRDMTRAAQSWNLVVSSASVSGLWGWPFARRTFFTSRRPSDSLIATSVNRVGRLARVV